MFQSHVIEVNGTFIGAAVTTAGGFRFRAVHPRVDELDGRTWRSLPELRRATGHLFVTGRLSPLALVAVAEDNEALSYDRSTDPRSVTGAEMPPRL
jgi:hypothetical protein